MPTYSDYVKDDYQRAIPGVLVYVFNRDGTLATLGGANPTITDAFGQFSFVASDDVYDIEFRYGGVTNRQDSVIVGNPPSYVGPPGGSDNTYILLATFKASDVGRKTASLVGVPGVADGRFNWTLGNFTGQADDLNIIKADSTALSVGAWVRQKADGTANQRPVSGAITRTVADDLNDLPLTASQMGAKGDDATDDTAAIQAAINAIVVTGKAGVVSLVPNKQYRCLSGITLDVSYVSLEGNSSRLSFPTLTGGNAALTIIGSATPPYNQATHALTGIELVGPGAGSNTIGIFLGQSVIGAEDGPSHIDIEANVSSFGIGAKIGHNAYLNRIIGDVHDCGTGVDVLGSTANATENLRMSGAIYNCALAIRYRDQSGSGTFFLDGMSLDYNAKLCALESRGQVIANSCWHECAPYSSNPITFSAGPDGSVDGAGFFAIGGRWLLNSSGGAFNYWADVPAGATCRIHPDFALRTATATGVAFTGAGESSFLWRSSFDSHGNNIVGHTSKYGLIDGNMEATGVVDWFIFDDTAAITSPVTGTNLSLSKSTAQAHSGTKSLKFTKVGGGGSAAGFACARPVTEGEIIGRRLWYRKPGAQTGQIFLSMRWGVVGYDGNGNPALKYADTVIGDIPLTFTSADTGWQKVEIPGANLSANRVPGGVTHAIILVIASNMDAGDVFFDDVWMGAIGCK